METLKDLIKRLEEKVDSLDAELTQLKASVMTKIKPVIIDIKPAQPKPQLTEVDVINIINKQPKAKVMPQLNRADVREIGIELFTLARINKLYGKK